MNEGDEAYEVCGTGGEHQGGKSKRVHRIGDGYKTDLRVALTPAVESSMVRMWAY